MSKLSKMGKMRKFIEAEGKLISKSFGNLPFSEKGTRDFNAWKADGGTERACGHYKLINKTQRKRVGHMVGQVG